MTPRVRHLGKNKKRKSKKKESLGVLFINATGEAPRTEIIMQFLSSLYFRGSYPPVISPLIHSPCRLFVGVLAVESNSRNFAYPSVS